ncbi:SDR family oxidoreductase [Glycomyces xiaoerkulensis]|uniref:SDR family oxidoreductase n=1 Tax=Glycomyces xiaoerkulensis TaxID=2038139 RepID=UPI000C25A914|nr:NAD(P)H-binding protein [Glycomyces xiaoerkulensis]
MIVVTGSTGNVGRPLVEKLTAAGESVVSVARGAEGRAGAEHRPADLTRAETLKPAFAGGKELFLLTGDPGLDLAPVLEEAASAGIGRVVLLSSIRVATRPEEGLGGFEDAVRESGLEWTILRPGGFFSNALLWAESVRAERSIAAPFGDVGLPHIDPADVAEVAARALLEPAYEGGTYDLTGPALVTPREQARAVAEALGEPVDFVELTREQALTEFSKVWSVLVVEGALKALGEPNEAELRISAEVERITGRPARSFADWARRNAGAFR